MVWFVFRYFVCCGVVYWHTLTIDFVGCGCLVIWFGVIYASCSFGGLYSRVDGLNLWLRLLLGLQGLGLCLGGVCCACLRAG